MEENVNEVLGIKESEDKKAYTEKSENIESGAENTLNSFAVLVLIFGIISSIICLISAFSGRDYYGRPEFNIMGVVYAILSLIPSLLTWSLMRVFVNISLTLKEINKKIKTE